MSTATKQNDVWSPATSEWPRAIEVANTESYPQSSRWPRAIEVAAPPLVPSHTAVNERLEAALAYARRGWFVFPVPPGKKKSYVAEKNKWGSGLKWGMTKDEALIRKYWARWPEANVGLPTGPKNGFWVVETDTKKGGHRDDGREALKRLEAEHGALPRDRVAMSPSESEHFYLAWVPGVEIRNSTSEIAPGIDVRADGGMVVAPPSVRGDSKYVQITDGDPPTPPDWIVQAAVKASKKRVTNGAAGEHTTTPEELDIEKLKQAIKLLHNNNLGWDDWCKIGMALWSGTGGSDVGLDLFDAFSKKCELKYDAAKTIEKWSEITGCPPTNTGLDKIYRLVDQQCPGWRIGMQIEDFVAYKLQHKFIYLPTGDPWPASSIDSSLRPRGLVDRAGRPILNDQGRQKTIKATTWLDRNAVVQRMTWAPGEPQIIKNKLFDEGGVIHKFGARTFNKYKPSNLNPGDSRKAGLWLAHVKRLLCEEASHVTLWLAHRVQRPHEKINHGLVIGGDPGIGKDTMLEPVKRAVGHWNWQEISPHHILGNFNPYVQAVVLRINEMRDMGDFNRYTYYERMKTLKAAPPDTLPVNQKYIEQYAISNVVAVVETTNYRESIWLPPDDRRNHVSWCSLKKEDFEKEYWNRLWHFYDHENGASHVMAYLLELDLSDFDPKAPPPKTEAFWVTVNAGRADEETEMGDVIDALGRPDAITIHKVIAAATQHYDLSQWLTDRRNSRAIRANLERCGYTNIPSPNAKDGRWRMAGKSVDIYVKKDLSPGEKFKAAEALCKRVEDQG
jgi:hypothetical protein